MSALKELRGYALAVILCAVALPIATHYDIPSSSFLLAAMATCLFGGRKPGLFAIGLLVLSFDYFFLSPLHDFRIAPGSYVRFVSFAGAMLLATELINAKRRSDLARLEKEREFRNMVETCPDCVLIVDESGLVQFANPATPLIFGYPEDEVLGKSPSFLLPELKGTQQPKGEFRARRKMGEFFDVEATCGGFGQKTTIFLRDISDRKRAQRDLEKSEENLRLILDTIPGMVYCRTTDARVEYVNRHTLEYFGNTMDELRAGAWRDSLHPDEKERVLKEVSENSAREETYIMEYRRRRHDGVYRWFQTRVQPLKDAAGKTLRWYGLLVDIDDRRRAEDALRQTEARLSRAAQMATAAELSASIVHEISQPIAAMVANGQACLRWLRADPPNIENGISSVERVVRDGKDAREIIKGLRTLFKRTEPQRSPLSVREIADEVLFLKRGSLVREGIQFEISIPGDLPPIQGDRIQMQQVLLNLVSNAIDALRISSAQSKKLLLRSRFDDRSIFVEVVDNGDGIEYPEKVFEAFFTTKEDGMGMGLPICKTIIEAHGGRLWASHGEPTGSIFCFSLPCSESAAVAV